MENCISNFKDFFEFLSYLAIIGASFTYVWSKKQVHFSTMKHCIKAFRNLDISTKDRKDKDVADYIDLVNEEFFYIENNYLHIEVAIEWIDGMIDYLPFIDNNQKVVDGGTFTIIKSEDASNTKSIEDLCKKYPRVLKTIKLNEPIDFTKIYANDKQERDKLIYLILSKLKLSHWKKIHLKEKINNR